MSGNEIDFAAYLETRWPGLVRSLVLLGCTGDEAEQIAQTALAYCYGDWDRVRRVADVDVHVYLTVLACLRAWRRHGGRPIGPVRRAAVTDEDTSELVPLRRALAIQLALLAADDREILVLRFIADLDDEQVARVLGGTVATVRHRVTNALGRLELVPVPNAHG